MVNDKFITWWLKTEFESQIKQNIFKNKHQAECWKHFHQVTAIQDGSPKSTQDSLQSLELPDQTPVMVLPWRGIRTASEELSGLANIFIAQLGF
ncbi:hypothetical protein VTN00DRAFT_5193 [Thermoascus crustaceus]|uniref:uncharacterized protein n=1 Tax=Thermoascus crustaceus TaxID=5088 RepID=UPI003743D55A